MIGNLIVLGIVFGLGFLVGRGDIKVAVNDQPGSLLSRCEKKTETKS